MAARDVDIEKSFDQRSLADAESVVYRVISGYPLQAHLYQPADLQAGTARPAVVFFHGGGWDGGSPKQFAPQCRALASRGLVAITVEYRTRTAHGTSPFEAVEDARAAIRWVRSHAATYHIDPDRIAAAGGSAGGHLAACTALLDDPDPQSEDSLTCRPDLLILFNPVIDTTEKGFGFQRLQDRALELSPVHHVDLDEPPTLIMVGDADTTTPLENSQRFTRTMQAKGNDCEIIVYPGQKHGFFNYGQMYDQTLAAMLTFLTRHGWLKD